MKVDADNRFAIIPEWILYHPELSAQAVRLFGVLHRCVDNTTGRGSPGRATLAKRLGCSTDTVDRAVTQLQEVGALEVRLRWRDKAHTIRERSLYMLKTAPPGGTAAATPADQSPAEPLTSDDDVSQAAPGMGGRTTAPTPADAATSDPAATPGGMDAATPGRKDAEGSTENNPENKGERTTALAPRPRDVIHDALAVFAEQSDPAELTRPKARAIGVAAATIRKVAPDVTPDEIERRAAIYPLHFRDATLTANALATHWARCANPPVDRRMSPAQQTAAEARRLEAVGQ